MATYYHIEHVGSLLLQPRLIETLAQHKQERAELHWCKTAIPRGCLTQI